MTVSKKQQAHVAKYTKANYDRLAILVDKGQKETIKAHAEKHNESINSFVNRAITETMERDNNKE